MLLNLSEITLFTSYGGYRSIFIFGNCSWEATAGPSLGFPQDGFLYFSSETAMPRQRAPPPLAPPSRLSVFTICTSFYSYWKSDLNGKNKMGKFRVDTLGKIASVGRGVYLRTGSWNPFTNLNGFLGTRGTRSNEGPGF